MLLLLILVVALLIVLLLTIAGVMGYLALFERRIADRIAGHKARLDTCFLIDLLENCIQLSYSRSGRLHRYVMCGLFQQDVEKYSGLTLWEERLAYLKALQEKQKVSAFDIERIFSGPQTLARHQNHILVRINQAYVSGRYSRDVQARLLAALCLHFPEARPSLYASMLFLCAEAGIAACFTALFSETLGCCEAVWELFFMCFPQSYTVDNYGHDDEFKRHAAVRLITALRQPAELGAFIRASAALLSVNHDFNVSQMVYALSVYKKSLPPPDSAGGRTLLLDLLDYEDWPLSDAQAPACHAMALALLVAVYPIGSVVEFLVYRPRAGWVDVAPSYLMQLLQHAPMRPVFQAFMAENGAYLAACAGPCITAFYDQINESNFSLEMNEIPLSPPQSCAPPSQVVLRIPEAAENAEDSDDRIRLCGC